MNSNRFSPINGYQYSCRFSELRDALEKLQLNDAALKVIFFWSYIINSDSFCCVPELSRSNAFENL